MYSVAMYKMSIIQVIVLLQLLHTGSSRPAEGDCCNEGQIVAYECQVPAVFGTLDWNGVGFDCPNTATIANNVLGIPTTPCPLRFGNVHTGECGPYFGNLTCTEDGAHLISVLEFKTNVEMNGGNISCIFNNKGIETFPVKIGVAPNPPSNVRVQTQQGKICHFKWTPPNEISVGGIRGYKIHYGDNCGNCSPAAGFVNQTEELTADCSECTGENSVSNMTCSFEVNTVSEDCSFDSLLVKATSVLMPCILETSNTTRVKIHSTIGDIPPGTEVVPHNTQLNFSCDFNCTPDYDQTRCANGTFEPSISPILRDVCHCSDDSLYIIIGSVFGGSFLVYGGMGVLLIIAAGYTLRKNKERLNMSKRESRSSTVTVIAKVTSDDNESMEMSRSGKSFTNTSRANE